MLFKKISYLILFIIMISCKKDPAPLKAGVDHCDHCHMQITDARFGAEIITSKGRIYKFDSIQCLHSFLLKNPDTDPHIFAVDYFAPDNFIKAEEADFLSGSSLSGPMGPGIIASKNKSLLEKLQQEKSGKVTKWKNLSFSSF